MSVTPDQRASLRQAFERTPQRSPVDLKVFRELVRRAPSSAWLAMARFTPMSAGPPTADGAPPSTDFWFGLYLVDSSSASIEVLGKVRGGARTWSSLDSLSDFVEGFLESIDLKGRVCVHVI